METAQDEGKYAIIKFLNGLGYILLEVEEMGTPRMYLVTVFNEASPNDWKHSLEGRDIDALFQHFIHTRDYDESKKPLIVQRLESCVRIKKFFHKDCKFILHLS
jgi:hypothetical protein